MDDFIGEVEKAIRAHKPPELTLFWDHTMIVVKFMSNDTEPSRFIRLEGKYNLSDVRIIEKLLDTLRYKQTSRWSVRGEEEYKYQR
jgi:hypothetical protein